MSILSKVAEVAAKVLPDRASDELRHAHRWIGRPVDRLDGVDKVTGRARFAAEYPLDGLSFAALVYSTIPKGTIERIDVADAEQSSGVIAVITHLNAFKMKDPPLFSPQGGTDAAGSKANVLNTAEVSWNGQPVAMVVADSVERAEHAAALVVIHYRPAEAAVSFETEKEAASQPKDVMGEPAEIRVGDAQGAWDDAAVRVDCRYSTPRYNHNPIELHATTAVWTTDDSVVVYDATQYIQGVRGTLAKMFSLNPDDVKVLSPFVGGGFGSKGSMWPQVQLAVLAARMVRKPVKLVLSRAGVFRTIGGRTLSEQRVALGADAQGALTSLTHTGTTATSFNNEYAEQFSFPPRHLYAAPHVFIQQKMVRLNTVANTFMRAPGESIGSFALESAMDELAWELTLDPVELRRRNEPARDPVKKTPFSERRLIDAYARGADRFGWRDRAPTPRATKRGAWWVGQGVASAYYPVMRMQASASVTIGADGQAVVRSSAQEMGMGTATVQSQHAAERLGLSLEQVRFEYGDSSLPPSPVAGGSNQTVSVALAVQEASEKLHRELLEKAAKTGVGALAHAKYEDVMAQNGGLYLRAEPAVGESYASLLAAAGLPELTATAKTAPPLESLKYSMGSYGAQFCEVGVNEHTGEVRVQRWLGVFDTGRIVNPKTARSQFYGGIVMGIGMALTEETLVDDRTGRILNPSLAEYHVPVHADVPQLDVEFLDIPDSRTPMGAHGIGEVGITGAAAAIANAVFHATGIRCRDLPITPDKLLARLHPPTA